MTLDDKAKRKIELFETARIAIREAFVRVSAGEPEDADTGEALLSALGSVFLECMIASGQNPGNVAELLNQALAFEMMERGIQLQNTGVFAWVIAQQSEPQALNVPTPRNEMH